MTDDRLTAALSALRRVPARVDWDDVERQLEHSTTSSPIPDGPRRHRRAGLQLLAAVTVAAVVVGLILLWPDARPNRVRTEPQPTDGPGTASSVTTDGEPEISPPGPTQTLRNLAVVAVAGNEYLVWAGETGAPAATRADGFAVDVDTGAVRPIPVAPIDPRAGATGIWTGTELIVCCGTGQADGFDVDTRSAAAWNPTTGNWRTLARPPASVARSFPTSVWTGELMVVIATGPAVAVYDPAADTWSEASVPPAIDRLPQAVWTGAEVILWDARYGSGSVPPDDAIADRGWRWAPGRPTWEPLPDLPSGHRTQLGSIAWTGSEVVVWGQSTGVDGTGVGARWRPGDNAWTPIGPSPQGPIASFAGTAGSQSVVSDREHSRVLVRALDGGESVPPLFEYDPEADSWATIDLDVAGYHPSLTVANDWLLVPDHVSPIIGALAD
jgi:hypothetical protein